jgi:hypothetical protein
MLGDPGILYGNTFVPFSMRVLRPRDTVVIRAVAVCAVGSPGTDWSSTAERVSLRARVDLRSRSEDFGIPAVTPNPSC